MRHSLDNGALKARHLALVERARGMADAGLGEPAVEATRVLNQLAEAYAWLCGGASQAAALTSAESLLKQADERLRRLERPRRARAGG